MLLFLRSRTFPPSDIGGRSPPIELSRARDFARQVSASLTLKLAALLCIFIAVPIFLYHQFESADQQRRDLVVRSIEHRNTLIAQALERLLTSAIPPSFEQMNEELKHYSDGSTILKLLFRPRGNASVTNFYYIASTPPATHEHLEAELARLTELGVVQRLAESCANGSSLGLNHRRPDGSEETLTSVVPISTERGCWVLVSANPTSEFLNVSIGRPYWQTKEIRNAIIFYVAGVIVAILIAASVWRSLDRFRKAAREIRQGRDMGSPFSSLNSVPELRTVAADFDRLVGDLRSVAHDIRQTAEDNAHSFKAPICTIQSSLSAVRKALPTDNERAERAMAVIETSIDRLHNLVNTSLRLDFNKADLIDARRTRVDLTRMVADVLYHYRDHAAEREVRLVRMLDENVQVMAVDGVLDVVIENLLDNALSFAPRGTAIAILLSRTGERAILRIEDEGPGVPKESLGRIFERYFSVRPQGAGKAIEPAGTAKPKHAGLGLWIVKQTVEGMGGSVSAANRSGGGLSVQIELPLPG